MNKKKKSNYNYVVWSTPTTHKSTGTMSIQYAHYNVPIISSLEPSKFIETPIGDLFVTWDSDRNIPRALLDRVPDSVYGELNPQGWDILDHEQLLLSLLETHKKSLLGIAANQLHALNPVPHRVCVILDNDGRAISLVNPHITKFPRDESMIESIEGCASLPGTQVQLRRYPKITVTHEKIDGIVETTFEDRAAIVAQHEIDHLDGILILHRAEDQNWKYREAPTDNGTT